MPRLWLSYLRPACLQKLMVSLAGEASDVKKRLKAMEHFDFQKANGAERPDAG